MPTSTAGPAGRLATIIFCLVGFCGSVLAQEGASYKVVAFTGQAAPGGDIFHTFGNPRIGADGTVGFLDEDLRQEGGTSSIFAGIPGTLRLVVSTGDSAAGSGVDGTFEDFQDLSVSKGGFVAFNGRVYGEGYVSGIWAETANGLKFATLSGSSYGSISALGTVGFRSGLIGVKGQVSSGESRVGVLLFGGVTSLDEMLREGQVLAGNVLRKIYDTSTDSDSAGTVVDVNESGAVAMKVIASPTATPSPRGAIYVGNPSAPSPVAVEGGVVPDIEGAEYGDLSEQPSIASNGNVAFSSTLNSEDGPASAIFAGLPGAISPLVQEGATVPTTADITFGSLSDAVTNATGDVVFRATIQYPDESTRTGIWIQRAAGAPVLIAVSGIDLPTPTGTREVTDVDFAGPGSINDLHEFVFRAVFSNGDQGIYLADTSPGAPTVHIATPVKSRNFVTMNTTITVAGTAADAAGISKVEYTVAREVSASKRQRIDRGRKLVISRTKLARGGSSWNFKVPLSMGLNLISIVATDKLGNPSPAYQVRVLRYRCGAK